MSGDNHDAQAIANRPATRSIRRPDLYSWSSVRAGARTARHWPRSSPVLQEHPGIRHIKVEDGPGRPLGRSFRVKVWPNLVFLRDGQVVTQLARPTMERSRRKDCERSAQC